MSAFRQFLRVYVVGENDDSNFLAPVKAKKTKVKAKATVARKTWAKKDTFMDHSESNFSNSCLNVTNDLKVIVRKWKCGLCLSGFLFSANDKFMEVMKKGEEFA